MTVKNAAESAAHPPVTFFSLAARDPEFAEQKRLAMEVGTDVLENEAYRRAVEGYDELVIGKVSPGIDGVIRDEAGNPVVVKKFDSRLLEVLLKGRRPAYRDNPRVDISNQTLHLTVKPDRSAALTEVARVLKAAGVDPDDVMLEQQDDLPVIEAGPRHSFETRKA